MENSFQLYLREQMVLKRRTYKHLSDKELIEQFRLNDSNKIFEEIYYRYSHLVLGTSMKYLKNEQDAEDCTMHIFEILPFIIKRYPITHFSSWLYKVVINECLQTIRKSKRNQTFEHNEELLAVFQEEEDTSENDLKRIDQFLTELKREQQRCVTEFYINKKSYQQIATENNWTVKQVKSAIQNGKRNLKLKFEEHEAKQPS